MSADRDKSQRLAFVYSNLYQLYKKEQAAKPEAKVEVKTEPEETSALLKTAEIKVPNPITSEPKPVVQIRSYQPVEILGKRIESLRQKEEALAAGKARNQVEFKPQANATLEGLKTNLKSLNELQSRLHFMLKEIEELAKDDE